jgi:hypothetical protein
VVELSREAQEALFPSTTMYTDSVGPLWREPAQGGPGRNFRADPTTMKPKILDGLASGLFPSEIARALGITPGTIRDWRRQDLDFDQMCIEAESVVNDQLEREAIRRAVRGVLEPVLYKGEVVMHRDEVTGASEPLMQRRYSDGLLQFLLKGRRSEIYGDKTKVEGSVGLELDGAKASLEQKLAQVAERLASQAAATPEKKED